MIDQCVRKLVILKFLFCMIIENVCLQIFFKEIFVFFCGIYKKNDNVLGG